MIDPDTTDTYYSITSGNCTLTTSANTPSTGQTTLIMTCTAVEVSGLPGRIPSIRYSMQASPKLDKSPINKYS